MKRNPLRFASRLACNACLILAIGLALFAGSTPRLLAQAVPDRINYQGILLKGDGTPVPATPTDVQFRIYDTPTLATGLQWGRMFRITPDTNGAFNVVLSSEGSLLTGAPNVSLASVFTSTGSDARYLELTVSGSTPIRPRQQFVASPYAYLAHDVTTARQNFSVAGILTVSGPANLVNLNASGSAAVGSLSAVGAIAGSSLTVTNTATIKGQLTVNSSAFVGGPLTVTGDTALNGKLTVTNGSVNMVSRSGYSAPLAERTLGVNAAWQSVLTSRSFTTDGFIVVHWQSNEARIREGWVNDHYCRVTIDGRVFDNRRRRQVTGGDDAHNEYTGSQDTFSLPLPKGATVAVDALVTGTDDVYARVYASVFFIPFGKQ